MLKRIWYSIINDLYFWKEFYKIEREIARDLKCKK